MTPPTEIEERLREMVQAMRLKLQAGLNIADGGYVGLYAHLSDQATEQLLAFAKHVAQAQRDLDAPYMQHLEDCEYETCTRDHGPRCTCTCGLTQVVANGGERV